MTTNVTAKLSMQLVCSELRSQPQEKKKSKSLLPPFDALFCWLKLLCEMCKHMLLALGPGFSIYSALELHSKEKDLDSAETQPAAGNVYCSYGCTVRDGLPA